MFIFARYFKIIARKERADIELMRYLTKAFSLVILFWTMVLSAQAQVTGVVVDRESGDTIPFASLIYNFFRFYVIDSAFGFRVFKYSFT